MIFELPGYTTKTVFLQPLDSSLSLVFQINPETIRDTVKTKIDSVPTINSNIPRSVVTGIEAREIQFTALFHAQLKLKKAPVSVGSSSSESDFLDKFGVTKQSLINTGVTLVPFASNVVRGIKTIADIAGITGAFMDEEFSISEKYITADIEKIIKMLFRMQVAPNARTPVKRIRIHGYPAFDGLDFYISEVNVNRRMWDKDMKTQFAEIQIRLVQAGADKHVGRFFSGGGKK